jgi:hypothetical protein
MSDLRHVKAEINRSPALSSIVHHLARHESVLMRGFFGRLKWLLLGR